jgi:phosphate binding protein
MNRIKLFHILSIVIVSAMALAACGGTATTPAPTSAPDQPTTAPEPTEAQAQPTEAAAPTEAVEPEPAGAFTFPVVDPAAVTGDIITAGSSTVFPLSERMAELFQQEGYSGNITVDSIGTGAGFERFCKTGETDISNASRAIKAEEREACQAIDRNPIEFRVGTDALAVTVSEESPVAARGLSKAELAQIFNGEVTKWNEIDPSLPAETIQIYSPGTDSGTFDYFVEAVLAADETKLLAVEGAQFSEDDNVLVQGVEGSPYAIGYFGYAYYDHAGGKLAALAIDGVVPSQESVDAGTYPLSRPLFIYSDAQIMADKPQVAAFIGFYLQNVDDNIIDVGYFPAPSNAFGASVGAWWNSTLGQ